LPAQWKHTRHGHAAEGAGYRPGTGNIKIVIRRVLRYTGMTCRLIFQLLALIHVLTPTSSAQSMQQTGC
jgi:hypothetical protein